ncbi:hook-length control protein FliK [Roseivivax halotolerans]|uniref:Hook-length control protein FliK n=1 Tax=Roseivivax halotolerans TaxID=93684 RepID=A0A1I5VGT6_9RHOB|nr:flagellar hook-length control protein FliK [Roseivivax halotolerans]SFQ06602.1 hook-length control protein FliK [Roseivivax halotolerans]
MDLFSHKVTTVLQIPDKVEGQAFSKNFSNCKVGYSFDLVLGDLNKNVFNEHKYHIDKDLKICKLSEEAISSHISSVENSVGSVCHEALGREFIVFSDIAELSNDNPLGNYIFLDEAQVRYFNCVVVADSDPSQVNLHNKYCPEAHRNAMVELDDDPTFDGNLNNKSIQSSGRPFRHILIKETYPGNLSPLDFVDESPDTLNKEYHTHLECIVEVGAGVLEVSEINAQQPSFLMTGSDHTRGEVLSERDLQRITRDQILDRTKSLVSDEYRYSLKNQAGKLNDLEKIILIPEPAEKSIEQGLGRIDGPQVRAGETTKYIDEHIKLLLAKHLTELMGRKNIKPLTEGSPSAQTNSYEMKFVYTHESLSGDQSKWEAGNSRKQATERINKIYFQKSANNQFGNVKSHKHEREVSREVSGVVLKQTASLEVEDENVLKLSIIDRSMDCLEETAASQKSEALFGAANYNIVPTFQKENLEAIAKLNPSQSFEIVSVSRTGQDLEISLNPEELGSVRLHLLDGPLGQIVSVSADRPETLSLLSRNIETLERYLMQSGIGVSEFRFGEAMGDRSQNAPSPQKTDQRHRSRGVRLEEQPDQELGSAENGIDIRI